MINRKYLIIPAGEISKIDFSQTIENLDNLQYTLDGKYTVIKWDSDSPDPDFISNIVDSRGPYNHSEMKEIIKKYSHLI
jgi:hypothetical protein